MTLNTNRRHLNVIIALITLITSIISSTIQPAFAVAKTDAGTPAPASSRQALESRAGDLYRRRALSFEPSFELNGGQTDASVKFIARTEDFRLLLAPDGAVMARGRSQASDLGLLNLKTNGSFREAPGSQSQVRNSSAAVLRMRLVGGNRSAPMEGVGPLAARSNYLIGSDPAGWRMNVASYAKVRQANVYSGIDLIYYGNPDHLEYDFIVAPQADTAAITLEFEGAEQIKIDGNGDLVMTTAGGEVRHRRPVIYQELRGGRQTVAGRYQIKGRHRVGFYVPVYDHTRALVIDPEIVFSTYLGGGNRLGTFKQDIILAMAVDGAMGLITSRNAGESWITNGHIANSVKTLALHPRNSAVFYAGTAVNAKAYLVKLNADGAKLMYASYLGGNNNDQSTAIALDRAGRITVAGITFSWNFPTVNAFQSELNGYTASFITRISGLDSLPEPKAPAPILDGPRPPNVIHISTSGKKLMVEGDDFSQGAVILINGAEQSTTNDTENPASKLYSKKAGKKIPAGDTVTVQVKNRDGALSNQMVFTRQ